MQSRSLAISMYKLLGFVLNGLLTESGIFCAVPFASVQHLVVEVVAMFYYSATNSFFHFLGVGGGN